jgi:fructose-1,6-bisphosphatase
MRKNISQEKQLMLLLMYEEPMLQTEVMNDFAQFMQSNAYRLAETLEADYDRKYFMKAKEREAFHRSFYYYLNSLFRHVKHTCPQMSYYDVCYFILCLLGYSTYTRRMLFAASENALKMRHFRLKKKIPHIWCDLLVNDEIIYPYK